MRTSDAPYDTALTTPGKVTVNIPVQDASVASQQLTRLIAAQVLVDDGPRYVLLSLGSARVAFVSGSEDITDGRPSIAVELEDTGQIVAAAQRDGLPCFFGRHASSRFVVVRLPGPTDLIPYGAKSSK